jgi:hypothetical protein
VPERQPLSRSAPRPKDGSRVPPTPMDRARRPLAGRGHEPAGRDHRAGRRAGHPHVPDRPGQRHPVVQRRLHAAAGDGADHRRPTRRPPRPTPDLPHRRRRVRARLDGLRTVHIGRDADRDQSRAGRRGRADHPADVRVDPRHVRRPGTAQGAGSHRSGDGAGRGVRADHRRAAHPRRPVRFVLAVGVPGQRAAGCRRPAAEPPAARGSRAGTGRARPARHGAGRARRGPGDVPADRGDVVGDHLGAAGRGGGRVRAAGPPTARKRAPGPGFTDRGQPVRQPGIRRSAGLPGVVLRGAQRRDAGRSAATATRAARVRADREPGAAAVVGRDGRVLGTRRTPPLSALWRQDRVRRARAAVRGDRRRGRVDRIAQ